MRKIEVSVSGVFLIENLASLCLSMEQIAVALGFGVATLYRLQRRDERVQQALFKGRLAAEVTIAKALFDQARAGNVTASIWLEKTRFGRRKDLNVTTCLNFLVDMDVIPPDLAAEIMEAYESNQAGFNERIEAEFNQYTDRP